MMSNKLVDVFRRNKPIVNPRSVILILSFKHSILTLKP
jgi:hypothetical protein